MGIKNALENRIRGWFPKEPTRISKPQTSDMSKILSYVVMLVLLAVIAAAVLLFYVPFYASQSAIYRGTLVIAIAITNTIIAYTFRKILPKPTRREHGLTVLLIAAIASVTFIYLLLMGV